MTKQTAPYDLNKCFVQMPWLVRGVRGKGNGFVMAHGAAEHAHQKSAVLLEEVHHCCPRYGVLMARIS